MKKQNVTMTGKTCRHCGHAIYYSKHHKANRCMCDNPEPKEEIQKPMTPEWWNDLYTDGAGNCFSDADGGL